MDSDRGKRVQSKDGASEGTIGMWLLSWSEDFEGDTGSLTTEDTYVELDGRRSVAPERSSRAGIMAPLISALKEILVSVFCISIVGTASVTVLLEPSELSISLAEGGAADPK
jgi:hypothetical protein